MRDVRIVDMTRRGVNNIEMDGTGALVPLPFPDAMVERAALAYREAVSRAILAGRSPRWEDTEEFMRAGLTAALTPPAPRHE